jgi:hypothetical protein
MQMQMDNKMELLIELEKLRTMGVTLSLPLNTDQPEWKLKHELERHLAHQTLVQRVAMIKTVLKVGSITLRVVFSSFLRLEGWDTFIQKELDTGKYDVSMEQMYRSLWRKGAPSPWITMGLLIFGSAIIFHLDGSGKTIAASPDAPGGMVGALLQSLFGAGGGNAGGFNPLSVMSTMFKGAMEAQRTPAPVRSGGEEATDTRRRPSPPPLRPQAATSSAAPSRERTRPRAKPP